MVDTPGNGHWLTVQQAAALLGKSTRTIRRWVEKGDLQSQTIDNRLWVEVSAYLPPESDITALRQQVDILRQEVTMLRSLVERQDGEIQFLRQAHAAALRLRQTALEEPGRRRWRWPWQPDD